jgi:alpha-D-ribose 1-methylphosphonate 5-triphosphate diphosphatase
VIALHAERVLTAHGPEPDCWVTVDSGVIAAIGGAPPLDATQVELGHADLIPGLVDLHSDCLEHLAHPRPNAELPLASALLELDALAISHGITTHLLCINLEDDAVKHRSEARARETMSALQRLDGHLRSDHRVHLRVDVTADWVDLAVEMVGSGWVGLLSYMDHTPGQGQYRDEEVWRDAYSKITHDSSDLIEHRLHMKRSGQAGAGRIREQLGQLARAAGVRLASHDDDGPESVARAHALGAAISEFPVSAEAASAAWSAGIAVVMGAPNARRGSSHLTNLSAREALQGGWLDALASDYHPPSLLAAAYGLSGSQDCTWADAVALVSAGPARAGGYRDRGAIAPGMRADLVAVELRGGHPVVLQTWVAGRPGLGGPTAVGAKASLT